MRNKQSAEFYCSWKNGIIWGVIALVAALLVHVGLWYFFLWYQDPNIFQNDVCMLAIAFTILSALFPVGFGLICYQGYRRIAANHPDDLHGVAHGSFGRPWILSLILLGVLEFLWLIISTSILSLGMELSWMEPLEQIVLSHFLTASVIAAIVDVALYLVGAFIFQPNQVREKR